jgi:hypothetical protein
MSERDQGVTGLIVHRPDSWALIRSGVVPWQRQLADVHDISATARLYSSIRSTGLSSSMTWESRKRHVAVDTAGLLLGFVVHAADLQDADGPGQPLRRIERLTAGWRR